jgi:hypothetical protein
VPASAVAGYGEGGPKQTAFDPYPQAPVEEKEKIRISIRKYSIETIL